MVFEKDREQIEKQIHGFSNRPRGDASGHGFLLVGLIDFSALA
jgi:hypothetical protein